MKGKVWGSQWHCWWAAPDVNTGHCQGWKLEGSGGLPGRERGSRKMPRETAKTKVTPPNYQQPQGRAGGELGLRQVAPPHLAALPSRGSQDPQHKGSGSQAQPLGMVPPPPPLRPCCRAALVQVLGTGGGQLVLAKAGVTWGAVGVCLMGPMCRGLSHGPGLQQMGTEKKAHCPDNPSPASGSGQAEGARGEAILPNRGYKIVTRGRPLCNPLSLLPG